MLHFPIPYEGEILHSIISRCQQAYRFSSKRKLHELLFGKRQVHVHVALPSYLRALISRLPQGHPLTLEKAIAENTHFAFYSAFMDAEQRCRLRNAMLAADPIKTDFAAAWPGFSIHLIGTLRLCPLCRANDYATVGEGYWHREHQLPGVIVCWKHGIPLLRSSRTSISGNSFGEFRRFVTVEEADLEQMEDPINPADSLGHAQLCASLLHSPPFSVHELAGFYRECFQDLGFASKSPPYVLNISELLDALRKRFGEHLVGRYWFDPDLATSRALLRELFCARHCTAPRHIMLMEFLGLSVEAFRQAVQRTRRMSIDQFPCRNPVAPCKGQATTLFVPSKTKGRTAIGCSQCGLVYSVPLLTREKPSSRYAFRIIRLGPIWREKLKELWNREDLGVWQIARFLGVRYERVINEAITVLGLPLRPDINVQASIAVRSRREARVRIQEKVRARHRKALLRFFEDNPGANRSACYQLCSSSDWLGLHDRAWLSANLPAKKQVKRTPKTDTKWAALDPKAAELVAKAHEVFLVQSARPEAVTLPALLRCLPAEQARIVFMCRELAQTRFAVASAIESNDSLFVRTLDWVKEQYLGSGETPSYTNFMKTGGERLRGLMRTKRGSSTEAHSAYDRLLLDMSKAESVARAPQS
jgi:hypothetical protein